MDQKELEALIELLKLSSKSDMKIEKITITLRAEKPKPHPKRE